MTRRTLDLSKLPKGRLRDALRILQGKPAKAPKGKAPRKQREPARPVIQASFADEAELAAELGRDALDLLGDDFDPDAILGSSGPRRSFRPRRPLRREGFLPWPATPIREGETLTILVQPQRAGTLTRIMFPANLAPEYDIGPIRVNGAAVLDRPTSAVCFCEAAMAERFAANFLAGDRIEIQVTRKPRSLLGPSFIVECDP